MTPEIWTIVGFGLAVLTAILAQFRFTQQRFDLQRDRTDKQIDGLRKLLADQSAGLLKRIDEKDKEQRKYIDKRLKEERTYVDKELKTHRDHSDQQITMIREHINTKHDDTSKQISGVQERVAHLEGLLIGLREAITGRSVA